MPHTADAQRDMPDGVFRMGTWFVNWYFLQENGRLTAIDAGLPAYVSSLDDDLAALGYATSDVEAVVLTHSDADHVGLAAHLESAGARVLIHREDEQTLRRPRPKSGDGSPAHLLPLLAHREFRRLASHVIKAGGAGRTRPDVIETFTDGDTLDVPGAPLAIHTPGHTPGHCALLSSTTRALFVGDALCTRNPATGDPGPQLMPRALDMSFSQAGDSLSRIESQDADVILPGHGDPWRGSPAGAVAGARARLLRDS